MHPLFQRKSLSSQRKSFSATLFDLAEEFWDNNIILAWALVLAGVGLVLWFAISPKSPGWSIGFLALAAGIMSVRPKMHTAEKLAWVSILIALTFLETKAIRKADKDSEALRAAQNQEFTSIAEGLKNSIAIGKGQYDSTLAHVNTVLETTQEVASLAKENIENVTGGNSFAYVWPAFVRGEKRSSDLRIQNFGAQTLTGIDVIMYPINSDKLDFLHPVKNMGAPAGITLTPIGVLAHGVQKTIRVPDFTFQYPRKYRIRIYAQNGVVTEGLFTRPSKDGTSFDYRLEVWVVVRGKHQANDVRAEHGWVRRVVSKDWTEPTEYSLP